MIYRVGNLKFKTDAGLVRALTRNGARRVQFASPRTLCVTWPAGDVIYKCDAEGRFDQQLEYDFYPDRRKA